MREIKAKVTISAMWADAFAAQFVNSLAPLLIYSQKTLCGPDEFIHYVNPLMSYHVMARNYIAEHALGKWVLMLDTDHIFAPDLLERLLRVAEKHNSRVISGIYLFKHPPHAPVANTRTPDGGTAPLTSWDPKAEILDVAHVGGGCLLIQTSVLEEIRAKFGCEPFDILGGLSEDYSFCERCYMLGIPVHLAMNVESHHLAPRHALYAQDYLRSLGTQVSTQQTQDPQGAAVLAIPRAADLTPPEDFDDGYVDRL